MANTWVSYSANVTWASAAIANGILNEGSRILRVKRVGLLNTQTTTVNGSIDQIKLLRYGSISTWASYTTLLPVTQDTDNVDPELVTCGKAGTVTTSGSTHIFRYVAWSGDEPSLNSSTLDEWECIVPFGIIFDCGFIEENLQPIVVRKFEWVGLAMDYGSSVGKVDSWIEFTDSGS
jgi:hypothetical protein